MSIISNRLRIDLWRVFFILLLCKKNKDKNIKRLGKNSTKLCFMYISKTLPYLEIGRHKICRRINFKFGMLWITIFCVIKWVIKTWIAWEKSCGCWSCLPVQNVRVSFYQCKKDVELYLEAVLARMNFAGLRNLIVLCQNLFQNCLMGENISL